MILPHKEHQIAIQINHQPWLQWKTQAEWQEFIANLINKILAHVQWNHLSEVSILLTDDHSIQELNLTYRDKDKPTNVLSFPIFTREEIPRITQGTEPLLLGDIALSLETVLNECEQQTKLFLDHISHLIIHGTLHLLGYDHEEESDAIEMESIEIEILSNIGITNPYN